MEVIFRLLVSNRRLLEKENNISIPYNMVTCTGIIHNKDIFKLIMGSICNVLEIKILNRKNVQEKEVEYYPTSTLLIKFEETT